MDVRTHLRDTIDAFHKRKATGTLGPADAELEACHEKIRLARGEVREYAGLTISSDPEFYRIRFDARTAPKESLAKWRVFTFATIDFTEDLARVFVGTDTQKEDIRADISRQRKEYGEGFGDLATTYEEQGVIKEEDHRAVVEETPGYRLISR